MFRRRCKTLPKVFGGLIMLCAGGAAAAQTNGLLLIRLKPNANIVRVARDYDLSIIDRVGGRNVFEVAVNDPTNLLGTATAMQLDRRVMYCEDDLNIVLPEVHAGPFHMAFDLTTDPIGYLQQFAYLQIDTTIGIVQHDLPGKANVTVAILDTGVNALHPSLIGKIVNGYNATSPGNPPVDIPDGIDNSAAGHGTMVAGLVARISPHSNIMPIKVLNADGVGGLMDVLQGLHYAVEHGADIINMSFGTTTNSVALRDAIEEAHAAGIIMIASAGNESDNNPHYPAAYRSVLGVASVDQNNTLSIFSNFGVSTKLVAPGENIQSTFWDGGYASWSGTSFAAPFVTAEAAELAWKHSHWSVSRLIHRIFVTSHSVDSQNPGISNMLGSGIIDFNLALQRGDDGDDD